MLDTAIIGGGLCGVVLARNLCRQGRAVGLFEARQRLGGRILSAKSAGSGLAMDFGPTWFWPDTQPLMTSLVAELELPEIAQHDDGSVLHLKDPDQAPERIDGKTIHQGAHRLQGGMARLIDALATGLPQGLTHLDHVLTSVRDRVDHVALTFAAGDGVVEIAARHVVLALPPRLLEQQVRFEPDLDEATREAMRGAETWMAAQAKVVIAYDRAFWREAGHSGNAFVTHEQAVLGEIFDACDGDPAKAALGGFLALSPELRARFSAGLPMLMDNQMAQVFGATLKHGEQYLQDWATELHTCSALDRTSARTEHVGAANPMLRQVYWNGKLYLGGSETAARGAGYLEGALEAARRIDLALKRKSAEEEASGSHPRAAGDAAAPINAASLARFRAWVAAQQDAAFDGYRHRARPPLACNGINRRFIMNEGKMTTDVAYAVCRMSDIPSQQARGFQLMMVGDGGAKRPWPILVVRWGRQVFGYVNKCPHDGVNLDWERNQFMDPNGIRLMCGKHGSLFELGTGICMDGPCKGRGLTPVALTVLDDDICVTGVTLVEDGEVFPDDEA